MRKYLAEILGTFVLVFFGCGTAVVTGCSVDNPGAYALTALAFGLAIVAMAYSVGNISGCHLNPAVSLAMAVDGRMTYKDALGYIVSQCIGGIAGGAALMAILGKASGLGVNALYKGDAIQSLLIETILTFVFVFVILGVTSKKEYSGIAGIVIGLSLVFVHILGIAFTGTSVNPARSLGPALFVGGEALTNVWVFILAPLFGGVLAACAHKVLSPKESEQ